MDAELKKLIEETWAVYRTFESLDVVKKVPPILFVGDLSAYERSKIKVITVALNPSKNGADTGVHAREFREWGIDNATLSEKPEKYLKGLQEYFEKDPATTYFSAFEPILNGMETSYYGPGKLDQESYDNRALHTDLCSQLTTNPNWGGLKNDVKKSLATVSSGLWIKLVKRLKPDLILVSFGKSYLKWINLELCDGTKRVSDLRTWDKIYDVPGAKPYIVNCLLIKTPLKKSETSVIAYGRNSTFGRPFNTASSNKKEIGRHLLRYMKDNGVI